MMKLLTFKKVIIVITLVLVLSGEIFLFKSCKNETDKDLRDVPEDNIALIKNQFQIEDTHYWLLSEDQKTAFSLPDNLTKEAIGEKITTITTSVDADYIGLEVYEYLPAGGKAIVAVKKDHEYSLFKFFQFESYINNKDEDEDVNAYLELYGINSAEDIKKVKFIGQSEHAKMEGKEDLINEIVNREKISQFYQFYSIIKDSSEEYFEQLFHYKPSLQQHHVVPDVTEDKREVPENSSGTVIYNENSSVSNIEPNIDQDYEDSSGSSTPAFEGSAGDALANAITIRIYNQQGIYFDTVYFPNIQFISRHKVNEEFATFLENYL